MMCIMQRDGHFPFLSEKRASKRFKMLLGTPAALHCAEMEVQSLRFTVPSI